MKYKAIIETDDYIDFEFFEDGIGKYMVGKDAGATSNDGWIPLYFTECEDVKVPHDDAISRKMGLNIVDGYSKSQSNVEDVTQDIISDLIALPPVTPQPKTGEWIERKNLPKSIDIDTANLLWRYECSECKYEVRLKSHYCPNCGAKMKNGG